jgi:hypothetical protein
MRSVLDGRIIGSGLFEEEGVIFRLLMAGL